MMWNPDQDPRELMTEFLNGYYGAAGPFVMKYLERPHALISEPLRALTFEPPSVTISLMEGRGNGFALPLSCPPGGSVVPN